MPVETTAGYAPVNGLRMYWESRGEGGVPGGALVRSQVALGAVLGHPP